MTDTDRGTYAPLPGEPDFEVDEYEDDYGRGPFLLFVAVVVLIAFAGVVYVAYQQGVQQGIRQGLSNDLPFVVAEPGPLKVPPEDPGGFEEPFQNAFVLNGETESMAETLLPAPEEPIQTPLSTMASIPANAEESAEPEVLEILDIATASQTADADVLIETASAQETVEIVTGATEPPPINSEATGSITEEVASATEVAQVDAPNLPSPAVGEPQPEPFEPSEPAPSEPSQPLVTSAPSAAGSGNFVVQVASVTDNDLALAKQADVSRKHGPVLAGLSFDIEAADLGDRGTYYRVRIGPFNDRSGAVNLCETLKGRGQDCYVTTP